MMMVLHTQHNLLLIPYYLLMATQFMVDLLLHLAGNTIYCWSPSSSSLQHNLLLIRYYLLIATQFTVPSSSSLQHNLQLIP